MRRTRTAKRISLAISATREHTRISILTAKHLIVFYLNIIENDSCLPLCSFVIHSRDSSSSLAERFSSFSLSPCLALIPHSHSLFVHHKFSGGFDSKRMALHITRILWQINKFRSILRAFCVSAWC